jgi:tRNA-(ms[2]io[6]A)-hydroxylase
MSAAAAPFAHALLRVPTPLSWLRRARASPDVLLIDHANCEKKAASTALALMFAYAEDLELGARMSRLAREELRHYEQVAKLIRTLDIVPRRLAPGRYAEGLRRLVAKAEPQREIDLMICGAFIEARSCERFARLAEHLAAPLDTRPDALLDSGPDGRPGGSSAAALRSLFESLHAAEARHYRVYLDLARRAAARASLNPGPGVLPFDARIEEFASLEATLIDSPDAMFRFHSGPPAVNCLPEDSTA